MVYFNEIELVSLAMDITKREQISDNQIHRLAAIIQEVLAPYLQENIIYILSPQWDMEYIYMLDNIFYYNNCKYGFFRSVNRFERISVITCIKCNILSRIAPKINWFGEVYQRYILDNKL